MKSIDLEKSPPKKQKKKEEKDLQNKDSDSEEDPVEEIIKMIYALMNTCGGIIVINFEHHDNLQDQSQSKDKIDRWKQNFNQRKQELLNFYKICDYGNSIIFFVKKALEPKTSNYNAKFRGDGTTRDIEREDVQRRMIENRNGRSPEAKPKSQLEGVLFLMDKRLERDGKACRENRNLEFKAFYRSIPDRDYLKYLFKDYNDTLKGCLRKYMSAFANTEGGSLVIGVNDDRIVKGYIRETKDEETSFTDCINAELINYFWNGKQLKAADCGNYWHVRYHPIESLLRVVIEISVHQVSRGMFYKMPEFYMVSKSKDYQKQIFAVKTVKEFDMWEKYMFPVTPTETQKEDDGLKRHFVENRTKVHKDSMSTEPDNSAHNPSRKGYPEDYTDDVEVARLYEKGCCIKAMAKHLLTLEEKKDDYWFSSKEDNLERCICNAHKDIIHVDQQLSNTSKGKTIAYEIKKETEGCCDVLVISEREFPKVICCFEKNGEPTEDQIQDALEVGRELKDRFLTSAVSYAKERIRLHHVVHLHFNVQVLNLPEGQLPHEWKSSVKQPVTYPYEATQSGQYEVACYGLAEMIMSDYRGEVFMRHLRAEQARTIFKKIRTTNKHLIVSGKNGTRKTEVALAMIKEAIETTIHSKRTILFICASNCVQKYERLSDLCTTRKINVEDSLSEIEKFDLRNYDLVVVRAFHALVLAERWEEGGCDLYEHLLTNVNSSAKVVIFVDSNREFKKFQSRMQDEFYTKVQTSDMESYQLQRIKNSPSNHTKSDTQFDFSKVRCDRQKKVGHVACFFMTTIVEENIYCLRDILDELRQVYEKDSIVILYSELEDQLRSGLQSWIKNGEQFSIRDTAMCPLEQYYGGGVEADVILFLFPPKWGLGHKDNERYIHCGKIAYSQDVLQLFLLPCEKQEQEIQTDQLEKELREFLILMNPVSSDSLLGLLRRRMYEGNNIVINLVYCK